MSVHKETGSLIEVSRSSKELRVEWLLNSFDCLECTAGDCYDSRAFDFSNARWCIRLFPDSVPWGPPTGRMGLFLMRMDQGAPVTLRCTLAILGAHGVGKREEEEHEFTAGFPPFGYQEFLPRNVLSYYESILTPNNLVTISCKLKTVVPSSSRGASYQRNEELEETEDLSENRHYSEKLGIKKLAEDFGKLLVSSENSDVTVQVGDTEFSVHRAILSARCPVLSAMFQHQTAEKASNKINVEDCEPDVFRNFLQYLYTGAVQSLTEQNVFAVYRVADKYLAEDLKSECLRHIRKTLCVQTFCETVKLALMHSETDLLQLAIDFGIKNIQLIVCSVEWQNFNCEYPREANEILIKCLVPRS